MLTEGERTQTHRLSVVIHTNGFSFSSTVQFVFQSRLKQYLLQYAAVIAALGRNRHLCRQIDALSAILLWSNRNGHPADTRIASIASAAETPSISAFKNSNNLGTTFAELFFGGQPTGQTSYLPRASTR